MRSKIVFSTHPQSDILLPAWRQISEKGLLEEFFCNIEKNVQGSLEIHLLYYVSRNENEESIRFSSPMYFLEIYNSTGTQKLKGNTVCVEVYDYGGLCGRKVDITVLPNVDIFTSKITLMDTSCLRDNNSNSQNAKAHGTKKLLEMLEK